MFFLGMNIKFEEIVITQMEDVPEVITIKIYKLGDDKWKKSQDIIIFL